jgi:hypothetical protein
MLYREAICVDSSPNISTSTSLLSRPPRASSLPPPLSPHRGHTIGLLELRHHHCQCQLSLNDVRTKWCQMMASLGSLGILSYFFFRVFRNRLERIFWPIQFRKVGTCIKFSYMIAACLRLELV